MSFTNREIWLCIFSMSLTKGKTDMAQMLAKYLSVCKEMGITSLSFPEINRLIEDFDEVAQAMNRAVDTINTR